MTDLTEQQVRLGIAPRSDQLNADDLVTAPVTVTIIAVRVGNTDCPWFIDLAEYPERPYKPCVTMRRLMVDVMGDKPKRWVGQQMTLYRDPEVKYKGETVGGIRISHFSALSEPKTVRLTARRGSKIEWVACPLETPSLSPEEQKYVAESTEQLKAAESLEELQGHGEMLKTKPKAIQDALRPIYATRLEELKQASD
jgi:hypothetical protein